MPRDSSHFDTRLVCPRGTDQTSEFWTPVTAPLLWQNRLLSSLEITPLRSGMLEMITVSVGALACGVASGGAGGPCAKAWAAEQIGTQTKSTAKVARGLAGRRDLTLTCGTLHPRMAA